MLLVTTVSWCQAVALLEVARDVQRRRAGVEDDALAVLDERRGGRADPPLLVAL